MDETRNHSEARARTAGLTVQTGLKAGGLQLKNHSEAQVRGGGLTVQTGVKAGGARQAPSRRTPEVLGVGLVHVAGADRALDERLD